MTNSTSAVRPTAGLAAAAEKTAALAAEAAEAADRDRKLSPAVAESLVSAGFSRHLVPARWGGGAGAPDAVRELTRALAVVGTGCMSAAWVGGVLTAVARMCSHLPDEGQRELWGDGPDVPLAGAFAPTGTVREVPGGWRIGGTWEFASGVDHAQWTMVGGAVPGPDGKPELRHFVLPRGDYTVRDTWHNVGLCGTGSNSVVVDEVFVPHHRTFAHSSVLAGHAEDSGAPRSLRIPHKLVNGLFFVAPGVGAVQGGIAAWTEWTAGRVEIYGARSGTRPGLRLALARAGAGLEAARLLIERAAAEADEGEVTREVILRATRDYSSAVDLQLEAVNALMRMSGARGQALTSPLQRVWRDVYCMAGHAALQPDVNADGWARHALGEES